MPEQVHFLDLIRYIMGMGGLLTFSDKVSEAFAEFIAEHNTLTVKQINFCIPYKPSLLKMEN